MSENQSLIRASRIAYRAASTQGDAREGYEALARELLDFSGSNFVALAIRDHGSDGLWPLLFQASSGTVGGLSLSPVEAMAWHELMKGKLAVIPSLERTPPTKATEVLRNLGIRSICVLPLVSSQGRLGGLAVGRTSVNGYTEKELEFLSLGADHIALALDSAMNLRSCRSVQAELRQQRLELQSRQAIIQSSTERLRLLDQLASNMAASVVPKDIFLSVAAELRRVLRCDLAGLAVPYEEGKSYRYLGVDFPNSYGMLGPDFVGPMETTMSGWIFKHGQPWAGSYDESFKLGLANWIGPKEGLTHGCHVPVMGGDRVVAVLSLARRSNCTFNREEADFAVHVAREISVAMDRAAAYAELHRAKAEIRKAFEDIRSLEDQLYKENTALRSEVETTSMFEEIVGLSPALQSVLSAVGRVSSTDSTVLISGETGTGKELAARAIHKNSRRSQRAFVSVNCAALPASLVSSELFGYEKGAFTGAQQRHIGRFEAADGGTIFLDEVGDLPAETQIVLLRVLQEREFERVGGVRPVSINVRVIAATNRDLRAAVAAGTFRADLFYRLNVFPIELPPLRARLEDIPLLVDYFVARYARKAGKKIRSLESRTLQLFQSYHWPGNVRELQNIIERAVILSDGEKLAIDPSWFLQNPPHAVPPALPQKLMDTEKELIESALAATRGRVWGPGGAAAKLGVPPSTLDTRLKSLRIDKYRFRSL